MKNLILCRDIPIDRGYNGLAGCWFTSLQHLIASENHQLVGRRRNKD